MFTNFKQLPENKINIIMLIKKYQNSDNLNILNFQKLSKLPILFYISCKTKNYPEKNVGFLLPRNKMDALKVLQHWNSVLFASLFDDLHFFPA